MLYILQLPVDLRNSRLKPLFLLHLLHLQIHYLPLQLLCLSRLLTRVLRLSLGRQEQGSVLLLKFDDLLVFELEIVLSLSVSLSLRLNFQSSLA